VKFGPKMDELTRTLRGAEDAIRSLKLGASAKAPMGPDLLTWRKQGAEWMFVVIDEQGQQHPLLACSAERRIRAVSSLNALLSELLSAAEKHEEQASRALSEAEAFIDRVRAVDSGSTP
jgi:hypothetical protein